MSSSSTLALRGILQSFVVQVQKNNTTSTKNIIKKCSKHRSTSTSAQTAARYYSSTSRSTSIDSSFGVDVPSNKATKTKKMTTSKNMTIDEKIRLLKQQQQRQENHQYKYASRRSLSSSAEEITSSSDAEIEGAAREEPLVSKDDEHSEEQKRGRLSDVLVEEVLKAKHAFRWVDPVILRNATVGDAIQTVIDGGLSGCMVIEPAENNQKKVVGLITSRDLLRIIAAGLKDGESNDEIMGRGVGNHMTPISQVIYGRPDETVGMCRTIMAKLGIKCLPILSKDGRVEGLLTARDMSDFGLSATDKGGKKNYLNDISERVGLSSDTSMAEPPTYMHAYLAMEQNPLHVNVGLAELPHPFKTNDSVGMNQRAHGPNDPSTDPELSEDAHFVVNVKLPDAKDGVLRDITYFGVADGVGSWREYDIDPRDFSHKLMEECSNILLEACQRENNDQGGSNFRRVIAPAEVLAQAYERVKAENVIGSCTACVALFDNVRHQLHFSNLGDSGIIVLRHIDSEVAGSLKRDRDTPREKRTSDLRVAFVSQQQLHSFNHPYQLGWTGEELNEKSSFKTARDSCTTSIHLRRGDIIIMATDGLFDNVDVDDIAKMGLEWEQKLGFIRGGDIAARERRWSMGNSLTGVSRDNVANFAQALCDVARERSLDASIDSPFAILAKENDIMWSGGMPDDCTVVVAHVVGRNADDVMDKDNL